MEFDNVLNNKTWFWFRKRRHWIRSDISSQIQASMSQDHVSEAVSFNLSDFLHMYATWLGDLSTFQAFKNVQ